MGCGASAMRVAPLVHAEEVRALRRELRHSRERAAHITRSLHRINLRAGCATETECSVCLEKPINAVLMPCGHACACLECAGSLLELHAPCPICRAKVHYAARIYLPTRESTKAQRSLSATWS
jgi:hypothetical protein